MERRLATLFIAVTLTVARDLGAQTTAPRGVPSLSTAHEIVIGMSGHRDLLSGAFSLMQERHPSARLKVDLGPLVDDVTGYLRQHGIPLRQDAELSGEQGIVFTAAFYVAESLEPMPFHIGDRGPFDAFYANDGGFRWSLTWPIALQRQLALQLEAGEDSELGNWAIVGVQWRHPRRPLAIGIGMPVALSNADGPVGVVCQIRMLLE